MREIPPIFRSTSPDRPAPGNQSSCTISDSPYIPMAHIEPFRALRYDPTKVSIPKVVTQPYDKITPAMQDGYYAASPHNLVRVVLGKEQADDHTGENRYSRAAQF